MLSEPAPVDLQRLRDQLTAARRALHEAENLIWEAAAARRPEDLVQAREHVRQAHAICWGHARDLDEGAPVAYPGAHPPRQVIGYLLWKLGLAEDSFLGRIVCLISVADPVNRERLRRSWPRLVTAWEAWQASATGEFEMPDA